MLSAVAFFVWMVAIGYFLVLRDASSGKHWIQYTGVGVVHGEGRDHAGHLELVVLEVDVEDTPRLTLLNFLGTATSKNEYCTRP